jgi:hypothetical protein
MESLSEFGLFKEFRVSDSVHLFSSTNRKFNFNTVPMDCTLLLAAVSVVSEEVICKKNDKINSENLIHKAW